ncbi:hypothetical protein DFH09DRAFT_1313779 [Mycena vulgaris]|nr:hypothetical protein DFH09DRAFT_1313779 [Mycena vulgaris]
MSSRARCSLKCLPCLPPSPFDRKIGKHRGKWQEVMMSSKAPSGMVPGVLPAQGPYLKRAPVPGLMDMECCERMWHAGTYFFSYDIAVQFSG